MSKSKEYWNKRFEQLEDAQMNKGASYFNELEKQYKKASNAVQRDIEQWYARFADNNEISLQEARKLLTSDELEEFKWSVMEYVEKGRTLNTSDQWLKQLKNASAKVHVTRLEAIKMQMQNHVEVLYGNEQDELAKLLEELYTEGYYHTAYEIQKGFNVGYDLMKLDTNKVEKLIAKPWAADGSNFSDRIWKQKSQLVSELHNNLTQAIIRGQHPKVVTDAIAKRFNVSKGQAGRLVMTESAFFASASNRDCYKDLGVEQYEILATLDSRTSDICQALDGKVFKMSEYEVGVTAPPFHTWCRTTTVPYFDDEFTLDETRAFRDAEGKTDYVPASMKYPEWEKKYVEKSNTSAKIKTIEIPITLMAAKGMNIDIFSAIEDEINRTIKEYNINMPSPTVKDLSIEHPNTPYMCFYYDIDGKHVVDFVINKGFDFTGFQGVVDAGYDAGYFAGKSVGDHIFHELVHIMTGQDIESASEFNEFIKELELKYVEGVSGYSDYKKDGFETLAEAAVKMRNNEKVPQEAKELVEKYIYRWKK